MSDHYAMPFSKYYNNYLSAHKMSNAIQLKNLPPAIVESVSRMLQCIINHLCQVQWIQCKGHHRSILQWHYVCHKKYNLCGNFRNCITHTNTHTHTYAWTHMHARMHAHTQSHIHPCCNAWKYH